MPMDKLSLTWPLVVIVSYFLSVCTFVTPQPLIWKFWSISRFSVHFNLCIAWLIQLICIRCQWWTTPVIWAGFLWYIWGLSEGWESQQLKGPDVHQLPALCSSWFLLVWKLWILWVHAIQWHTESYTDVSLCSCFSLDPRISRSSNHRSTADLDLLCSPPRWWQHL